MKEFLYVLLIGFVIGSALTYFVKPSEVIERIDSVTVAVDTNKLFLKWNAKIKPEIKWIRPKNDTIKDTTYLPAELDKKKEWYSSIIDTTLEGENVQAKLRVESFAQAPVELSLIDFWAEAICVDSVKTEYKTIMEEIAFYEDLWFWFAMLESLMIVIISIL